MGTTDRANGSGMPDRQSETELTSLRRLGQIATKGMQDPDALTRVEILEVCKLALCHLTWNDETRSKLKKLTSASAMAEMVRLSQELGLE